MTEKHIFAGNNTEHGFFSYFNDVFNADEYKRIFIMKGGPGVGKSTFMKKAAAKLIKEGHTLTYVHCSSDNNSLDGIIIHDLSTAFVDGTAPHVLDPVYPGAADEIINLGEYLDNARLQAHRDSIVKYTKNIKQIYKSAYRYLGCAGILDTELASVYERFTDQAGFIKLKAELVQKLFGETPAELARRAKLKRMFCEAYTANGYINYTDVLCKNMRVWTIIGENSEAASALLCALCEAALQRGFDLDAYFRPLKPDKIAHIAIPALNLFIKSSESYVDHFTEEVIDLNPLQNKEQTSDADILNIKLLKEMMIRSALEKFEEINKLHDELEKYYISCMDFPKVEKRFNELMSTRF